MATLGETIRARRDELGMTQEQLAERLGHNVRQSEISRLEHDRVKLPRRQRIEKLAAVLELPLGELLARSGWIGAAEAFPYGQEPHSSPEADTETAALEHVLADAKEVVAHLQDLVDAVEAKPQQDASEPDADAPPLAAK